MSASFWFFFWIFVLLAFLNVLYGMWLLGRFNMTDESALEPRRPPVASTSTAAAARPAAWSQVARHQYFNQVRREAVTAALNDFGGRVRTTNPYVVGSAAYATWSSHYDRIMHDQFTLELARLEADTMERA